MRLSLDLASNGGVLTVPRFLFEPLSGNREDGLLYRKRNVVKVNGRQYAYALFNSTPYDLFCSPRYTAVGRFTMLHDATPSITDLPIRQARFNPATHQPPATARSAPHTGTPHDHNKYPTACFT